MTWIPCFAVVISYTLRYTVVGALRRTCVDVIKTAQMQAAIRRARLVLAVRTRFVNFARKKTAWTALTYKEAPTVASRVFLPQMPSFRGAPVSAMCAYRWTSVMPVCADLRRLSAARDNVDAGTHHGASHHHGVCAGGVSRRTECREVVITLVGCRFASGGVNRFGQYLVTRVAVHGVWSQCSMQSPMVCLRA